MRSREYEQALQELGALREAGKVSQEYYDVTRAKMLAESTRPRSWLLSAVTVVAIFVLLVVLIRLGYAVFG